MAGCHIRRAEMVTRNDNSHYSYDCREYVHPRNKVGTVPLPLMERYRPHGATAATSSLDARLISAAQYRVKEEGRDAWMGLLPDEQQFNRE